MKRLLLGLCLVALLALPSQGWAAIAFVSSVSGGSTDGNTFTTGTFDSTGANFIVCTQSQTTGTAIATITDSKSNTWSTSTNQFGNSLRVRHSYAMNATVGSGHTITVTGSTGGLYSVACLAFSGVATSSALENETFATGSPVSSLATGSISAAANSVTVIGLNKSTAGSGLAIDTGFTKQEEVAFVSGQHDHCAIAYLINAGTTGATWTWATNASAITAIVDYLCEGACGSSAALPQNFPIGVLLP